MTAFRFGHTSVTQRTDLPTQCLGILHVWKYDNKSICAEGWCNSSATTRAIDGQYIYHNVLEHSTRPYGRFTNPDVISNRERSRAPLPHARLDIPTSISSGLRTQSTRPAKNASRLIRRPQSTALHKEVQILQRLQYPNICQLKEVFYEENYIRESAWRVSGRSSL